MSYWGASKGAQKFYRGSKHDSEWNRELLWRMYVESENEFYSLRKEGGVPPYMESVAAACALAPRRRGAQKAKQGLSSVCPNAHEVRHAGALPQLSPIRASQAIGEFVGTPAYEEHMRETLRRQAENVMGDEDDAEGGLGSSGSAAQSYKSSLGLVPREGFPVVSSGRSSPVSRSPPSRRAASRRSGSRREGSRPITGAAAVARRHLHRGSRPTTQHSRASGRSQNGAFLPTLEERKSVASRASTTSTARAARLETMLERESELRATLQRDLEAERRAREKVEASLGSMQSSVQDQLQESRRARESTEQRLRSYQGVMKGLLQAVERSHKRKQQGQKGK